MHEAIGGRSWASVFADEHDDTIVQNGAALVEGHDRDVWPGYDYLVGFDAILGGYIDPHVKRPVDRRLLIRSRTERPYLTRTDKPVSR